MIVIGLDVHKQSVTAVAVDEAGRPLDEKVILVGSDELLVWAAALDGERLWAVEDCRQLNAIGTDALRVFFSRLFGRPRTYGWSEPEPLHAGGSNEFVWFVAPTTVIIRDEDGNERRAPYRVSGVLELASDERWLFRLFNGSEPTTG